jgi:hypothetical protein
MGLFALLGTGANDGFGSRLLEAGVDVRFADLPMIEGATGKFLLQQMAAVAEFEAGMLGSLTLVKIGEPSHTGDLPLRERSFRQTGRNLDIRLGSCEGITDPWRTPSAESDARVRGKQGGGSP